MRHRKTACFQALVLDPYCAQMLRPLLATLLFPWLAEVRCKYLNVLRMCWSSRCLLSRMRQMRLLFADIWKLQAFNAALEAT